jgi:hypothetical protein
MGRQAARYFAYSKNLLVGIVLGVLSVSLMSLVAAGLFGMFFINREYGWMVIAGMVGYAVLRLFRAIHGSGCHCQLCHGPVLVNRDCNKHRDAKRYPLLSYRRSLLVDVAVKGKFNCMYCGTPYRVWR